MMPCSAALDAEQKIASRLTAPVPPGHSQRRFAQSLAKGAAGTVLLHIERALQGTGTWQAAHDWLQAATRYDISAADEAALFIGAPCINFVLHAACADGADRYGRARAQLDSSVTGLAHRRVDAALRRIEQRQLPRFAEYDLFYGLTGLGTLLLHHQPGHDALGRILAYLVRLATEPIKLDDRAMPGWWVHHDPDTLVPTQGGHANFGLAHGISGPLALLALAMRAGITIDRHAEAIEHICAWLNAWRQEGESGPWWPQWITAGELRQSQPEPGGPYRPSWCYGTPGIARAQQLAALATGDSCRRSAAEHAIAASLSDPRQLGMLTDAGLCHGTAGAYQTAWRANCDAITTALHRPLVTLAAALVAHAEAADLNGDFGLLDGAAGVALALQTLAHGTQPRSGWDVCLLLI